MVSIIAHICFGVFMVGLAGVIVVIWDDGNH